MKAKIKTDTIVRTIVLVLALFNQILAIKGKEVLPVTEDEVYQLVSLVATIGASLWAWWKNNSFTEPALMGDQLKDQLKQEVHERR